MTRYRVKMVDHTASADSLKQGIQSHIHGFFDDVFAGMSDSATVEWGSAEPTDRIVLHFVEDVASSYIQQQMPGASVGLDKCGHTRTRSNVTGSEFYKYVIIGGVRTMVTYIGYAKCAFHEALHNQYPFWSNDDLHGPNGGFGLAASPPQLPMTDRNKVIMRNGMAIPNNQLM